MCIEHKIQSLLEYNYLCNFLIDGHEREHTAVVMLASVQAHEQTLTDRIAQIHQTVASDRFDHIRVVRHVTHEAEGQTSMQELGAR